MIYFDVTKAGVAEHRSGLTRVSSRLREELGSSAMPVIWKDGWRVVSSGATATFAATDWLLTPELFCEAERPGFREFVRARTCRLAAIFHDAIPLKFPRITWPQSVSRHPEYMKLLASFDRVFAVSEASRAELIGFWKWQGATVLASAETIALGADALKGVVRQANVATLPAGEAPLLLCIGILEPRKNQALLADVAETLAAEGLRFQLEIVGRVNPHFGKPLAARLRALSAMYPAIHYREAADDGAVAQLWRKARASVFPTLTEGCGLPLLESLWMGVPCVCSDLPVLRENGEGGGCEFVPVDDRIAWTQALRRILVDDAHAAHLRGKAVSRVVPTWRQTAEALVQRLSS